MVKFHRGASSTSGATPSSLFDFHHDILQHLCALQCRLISNRLYLLSSAASLVNPRTGRLSATNVDQAGKISD